MAMSGLEPSALNYLQVRAAGNESSQGTNGANGYDRLERLRIQLASSGPIAEVSHLDNRNTCTFRMSNSLSIEPTYSYHRRSINA